MASTELDGWLCLGMLVLALIAYFISFSDAGAGLGTEIDLLLAGGVLAALRVVPRAAEFFLPAAVVLSVVGALALLADLVHIPANIETPTASVLIFVVGIVQMLVAIAAYLMDKKVISLPHPGRSYGQPGSYAGPGGQSPAAQRTRYVPPNPQQTQQPQAPQAQAPPQGSYGQQPPLGSHGHAAAGTQQLPGSDPTSYMPASGNLDEGQAP